MYGHDRRTPTDPNAPEEVGYCDRCQFKYPLSELPYQYDVRGQSLKNTGLRVCPRCYDDPAWILAPIEIHGPEGTVQNPRPFLIGPGYADTGKKLPVLPNSPLDGSITD